MPQGLRPASHHHHAAGPVLCSALHTPAVSPQPSALHPVGTAASSATHTIFPVAAGAASPARGGPPSACTPGDAGPAASRPHPRAQVPPRAAWAPPAGCPAAGAPQGRRQRRGHSHSTHSCPFRGRRAAPEVWDRAAAQLQAAVLCGGMPARGGQVCDQEAALCAGAAGVLSALPGDRAVHAGASGQSKLPCLCSSPLHSPLQKLLPSTIDLHTLLPSSQNLLMHLLHGSYAHTAWQRSIVPLCMISGACHVH